MIAAQKCRVDSCDRNAAASMVRENLPGPLPLCATHTEEFRQNGDGWTIVWDHTLADPSSVTTPAADRIGRSESGPLEKSPAADLSVAGVRSRLTQRLRRRP